VFAVTREGPPSGPGWFHEIKHDGFRILARRGPAGIAQLLNGSNLSIVLNEHFDEDGAMVYRAACQLGCEGIVSKRLGSPYRSGRSPHWVKVKNPKAPRFRKQ
jgi:ATP-dependent DNA ligase